MPPELAIQTPDFSRRSQLTELMDEPCSRDELRACLRDLALVNRWTFAYRPVRHWLEGVAAAQRPSEGPLRILDVACGYGDGLREIERWALRQGLAVELTGLDLNPNATSIAAEATHRTSKIRWINSDIFAYTPQEPPDLVLSSLFTHHLAESDIVRFIQWMDQNARLGWFISDLSRAAIPYHFFRVFSKVAGLHRFVQHDGPVSIARAFVDEDWRRMCGAAGLGAGKVEIRSYKPARLCVARQKPQATEMTS